MFTGHVFPFVVKKNVSFDLYSVLLSPSSTPGQSSPDLTTNFLWKTYISKDGGALVATTNSPVVIDDSAAFDKKGYVKLTLTADEMNANVIMISIVQRNSGDTSNKTTQTNHILYTDGLSQIGDTGSGGGGATAEQVWGYTDRSLTTNSFGIPAGLLNLLCKASNEGYIISTSSYNDNGYNYIGCFHKKGIWFIARYQENLNEVEYVLVKVKDQTFSDGWTNRTTLNYQLSEPIL